MHSGVKGRGFPTEPAGNQHSDSWEALFWGGGARWIIDLNHRPAGSLLVALSSFVDWLSPILLRTRLVSQAGFRMRSLGQAPCFNSPRKWGLVWNFLFNCIHMAQKIRSKQTPWTSYFSLWQESRVTTWWSVSHTADYGNIYSWRKVSQNSPDY